jgi:lipopolysaccharide/colanic/teichoic acid biosynthesis glycosyltransferase
VTSADLATQPDSTASFPSDVSQETPFRVLNVAVAAVSLVVAAPLMAVIAALIRLTSPGPALYRQTRIGLDRRAGRKRPPRTRRTHDMGGLPFTIYKFRTMYVNGNSAEQETWATPNDPRVTPLGRVLRGTRLDELPQLFNVLLGDMNVVGPRPEQPTIFARLREEIDGYPGRQRVRPGITGLAQVRHTYDRSVDDVRTKLVHDLEYIENRSLAQDLKILLWTPFVMLFKRGSN